MDLWCEGSFQDPDIECAGQDLGTPLVEIVRGRLSLLRVHGLQLDVAESCRHSSAWNIQPNLLKATKISNKAEAPSKGGAFGHEPRLTAGRGARGSLSMLWKKVVAVVPVPDGTFAVHGFQKGPGQEWGIVKSKKCNVYNIKGCGCARKLGPTRFRHDINAPETQTKTNPGALNRWVPYSMFKLRNPKE